MQCHLVEIERRGGPLSGIIFAGRAIYPRALRYGQYLISGHNDTHGNLVSLRMSNYGRSAFCSSA